MKSVTSTPVLVLDRSYIPVNIVPARRAISYLVRDKASVVENRVGVSLHSDGNSWDIPSVIKLSNFLGHASYSKVKIRFNKRALMERDGNCCQYCDKPLIRDSATVDHVIPKGGSYGGTTTWKNCVIACRDCNAKKGNRTPKEAGMKLKTTPKYPHYMTYLNHMLKRLTKGNSSWKQFFLY